MSVYHYYIVELDLRRVTGACTNNGNPGYSTSLTCTDQSSLSTVNQTHKFTDTGLILFESGVHKCVHKVSETTPKLKAGNGVASRAKCNITFKDFIGDPNLTSPALVANPSIEDNGTFFGKMKERNILTNRPLRVKYYKRDGSTTTLVRTNHYIAVGFKQSKSDLWTLTCQDVLYRVDDTKSQFPALIKSKLNGVLTAASTSIPVTGNIADWTPHANYTAVIGDDLLMIVNATGDATNVTLTVARATTITLGSRTIFNTPTAHAFGDEVFRGRKFVDADLYDVITAVFEDGGMVAADYDGTAIAAELDTWIPSVANSIDAIFYESEESTKVLDKICAEFMLDIYTDTSIGKATLKATSPWNTTTSILTEGNEITLNSVDINESEDLFYSRAFLQYDKRGLLENDDSVNFKRSSLAFNDTLEGPNYYGEEKVKKMGKSIILSNKSNNIEVADLSTVRYAQRFSNRPQTIDFSIEEQDLDFKLGDVVEIIAFKNQDMAGNIKQGVRSQVVQITPSYNIGRQYKVSTITYNPFVGGAAGSDFLVSSEFDNNLFTIAGGPVASGTFTFIFNNAFFGQDALTQAINIGSIPSGSTVNIVYLSGSIAIGKAGYGGNANAGDGGDGGITLNCTNGVTINIYLNGTTPDFGSGTYSANGYLYAPGGGGPGGKSSSGGVTSKAAGGGGAGNTIGLAGTGTDTDPEGGETFPANGNKTVGGVGGSAETRGESASGGVGGNPGVNGGSATGDTVGTVGTAGKGLVLNGATVNIITNGATSRFIQGSGDAPTSIS